MLRRWCILLVALALLGAAPFQAAAQQRASGTQELFERLGSGLAGATFGDHTAAEVLEGYASYYGLDIQVLVTVLELSSGMVASPNASQLDRPFGPSGPSGFEAQTEWAVRELRAGFGPYQTAPTVKFSDGESKALDLGTPPAELAVQRFLAAGRSSGDWEALIARYSATYAALYGDQPQDEPTPTPQILEPFLSDPWLPGTRVVHSSWFDHAYPMVDVGGDANGTMVDYLGRSGLSYNSHDGHDFYFPDRPYGTPIIAAADGWAYAYTARGYGVVVKHTGAAEGYETVYWHFESFAPVFDRRIDNNEAVWVKRGDLLGFSGATGFTDGAPHLHFEVRFDGRQVDPFGWYGPGDDPCLRYAACAPSHWMWVDSSMWPRPDRAATADKAAPQGLLTINPPADLHLAAHFDGLPLPDVGSGMVFAQQVSYEEGRFGEAARSTPEGRLSMPISPTALLDQGTVAVWFKVPEQFPKTSTGRTYLLATSAHPDDQAGVYSNTLALRHEQPKEGKPLWTFWTVGEEGREHKLSTPDTLEPGWHHFAITWSRFTGLKTLYIDGRIAALAITAPLPSSHSDHLELGRWNISSGIIDGRFDDLAIWSRWLRANEIAAIADSQQPVDTSAVATAGRDLMLVTQAFDDGGGIAQVQLGINGRLSTPMPYYNAYRWRLPASEGAHEISVTYIDRVGNSTTLTKTIELRSQPQVQGQLTETGDLTAVVSLEVTDITTPAEMLVSNNPEATGPWMPLADTVSWAWRHGQQRILYLRVRDSAGVESDPIFLGPDVEHTYLPLADQ